MIDQPTPSFIHPSAKWQPDSPRAKELIEELLKETGAQSLSVILYDCPMPCPEIVATGICTVGHRYAVRGNIDTVTEHEIYVQLLKACPGHKTFLKSKI